MSTLRLPPLNCESGENSDETRSECLGNCHSKSKEQHCCCTVGTKSVNKQTHSADEDVTNLYEDKSMLEALDSLSDYELDELLQRTLALNNKLKEHLKNECLSSQINDRESRKFSSSRARNTVVLPPILKKDSAMSTRLTANR